MEKETFAIIFFGVFFLLIILGYKLIPRSKRRYSKPRVQRGGYWSDERRHFDSQTKRNVLSAQKQRCNFCKCELAAPPPNKGKVNAKRYDPLRKNLIEL